jgi:hypothetical protein
MGSSAASRLDSRLHDLESSEQSDGEDHWGKPPSLSRAPTMPLAPSAVDLAEEPTSRPWCIDHGRWLEAMSTADLWRALELGLLPQDIRVWREGLECWTPACDVRALGWAASRQAPACVDLAATSSDEGSEPCSTGPLSFALTPEDLRAIAPRWDTGGAQRDPGSSQVERAERATITSRPPARLSTGRATRDGELSGPVSLELPSSFPHVPSFAPETLRSALDVRPALSSASLMPGDDVDGALPDRASYRWTRVAKRLRDRRNLAPLAAGSAVAALAIGLALLDALTPPHLASTSARVGLGPGAAEIAARVAPPAAVAPAAVAPAAVAPGLAASTPGLVAPATPGLAASAAPGLAAPAAPGPAAPRPAVRRAPDHAPLTTAPSVPPAKGRHERGQYRLRRGHAERPVPRALLRSGS